MYCLLRLHVPAVTVRAASFQAVPALNFTRQAGLVHIFNSFFAGYAFQAVSTAVSVPAASRFPILPEPESWNLSHNAEPTSSPGTNSYP